MRNCGICGTGLNQPLVPETMEFRRRLRSLHGRSRRSSKCIDLLKKLGDTAKRPAEVATYEVWRVKQV